MKSDILMKPLLANARQAQKLLGNISKKTLYNWTAEFNVSPVRRGYYLISDLMRMVNEMKKKQQSIEYLNLKKIGLD